MNMNFGNEGPPMELGGSGSERVPWNFSLPRQGSIYAMTFDELQSTMGSGVKDFGSMNMDELLKSIWSAEETQIAGNNGGSVLEAGVSVGNLHRQGSLSLPRTLSLKTVDEVWRDMSKECANGFGETNFSQGQQTLGNMTLEDFLFKAGVVKEENHFAGEGSDFGLFGNSSFGIGFQQPDTNLGVIGNTFPENGNQISFRSANLPMSVDTIRYSEQQPPQMHQQEQDQHSKPFPCFVPCGSPTPTQRNVQLGSRANARVLGEISHPGMNVNMVASPRHQGGGMGVVNLGTVVTQHPALSGKTDLVPTSVPPAPFLFNGLLRRRKSSSIEKVIERRHKRMVKNRESAARSRARKQAYTTELESEVAKLKEQNQELRKKLVDLINKQKNEAPETMNTQQAIKRRHLTRKSGPW